MNETHPPPHAAGPAGAGYDAQALHMLTELRARPAAPDEALALLRLATTAAAAGITRRRTHADPDPALLETLAAADAGTLVQTARDLLKEATPRCWREVILLCEALILRAQLLNLPVAIGEVPMRREKAAAFALQRAQAARGRGRPGKAFSTLRDLLVLLPDQPDALAMLEILDQPVAPEESPGTHSGLLTTPPLPVWDQISPQDLTEPAGPRPGAGRDLDLAALLGPRGPIAAYLGDRYHFRSGQLEMAEAVLHAIEGSSHALIEAGTGSGKSFAYLVPAVWSGQRVLVATANKLLQDQLWLKDIPALQKIAPRPFRAALLKGRSNYICNRKLDQMAKQPSDGQVRAGFNAQRFLDWARSDNGELDALDVPEKLRGDLTIENQECLGTRCPLIRQCFYERAKRRLETADVAVINHSLLALNLNSETPFFTVPDVVVVDEAHELATYAATALQLTLTYGKLNAILNSHHANYYLPGELRSDLQRANNLLFAGLADSAPAEAFGRWPLPGEQPAIASLALQLETALRHLRTVKDPYTTEELNAEFGRFVDNIALFQFELQRMAGEEGSNQVRFVERGNDSTGAYSLFVIERPLEVGAFLADKLFAKIPSVICTSATLRTSDGYAYFRRQVGAPEGCRTLDIASPFDYPRHVLIYTPRHLAPPAQRADDTSYQLELAREVYRLLTYSMGRALVLCTSFARMNYLYETVSPHLAFPLLRQGEAPRAELIRRFEAAGNAVLFATRSFWQGIDIPGDALSLVIIDRLPFPVPSDPVVAGRERLLTEQGGRPFQDLMLPEATLALKQGVGRLMRAESDRGVIALLDSRLVHKQYGAQVLAALPPGRVTSARADVKDFFASAAVEPGRSG